MSKVRFIDLRKMRHFLSRSDVLNIKTRLLNNKISQIAKLEHENAALRKVISAVKIEIETVAAVKKMAISPSLIFPE